jgi:hypothetical protein
MWSIVQKRNPIWYFDSTGSIIKKIDKQKNPFLYSFVCHDTDNMTIFPVADFVTTSHTSLNISCFIFRIKKIFDSQALHTFLPQTIVTDFSWALINSVMDAINNCSLSDYLELCFDAIFNNKNLNKTKLCLCAAHFLKMVIRKLKNQKCGDSTKKCFTFCFTLLQNSLTLEEFENHLKDVYIVFNSKKRNNLLVESSLRLKKALLFRNISKLSDLTNIKDVSDPVHVSRKNDKFKLSLASESPFTKYFTIKINYFSDLLKQYDMDCNNNNLAKNENYCPALFEIINEKLYILPMWSGLLLNHGSSNQVNATRITNNAVENWFGQLKNNILQNRKVMPSELVSSMYKRLLSKYFKFYNNELVKNNATKIPDFVEIWKDKKERLKKRRKGYYYEEASLFDEIKPYEFIFDSFGNFFGLD